jgi:hypothetical protein
MEKNHPIRRTNKKAADAIPAAFRSAISRRLVHFKAGARTLSARSVQRGLEIIG